jgi:hypothetical protein
MKLKNPLLIVTMLLLAGGCASRRFQHIEVLRQDPTWPTILSAAELEASRREGNTQWSHSAYYTPEEHTNGVWYVIASGSYPLNRLGDSIDILIQDDSKVLSYSPRRSSHPK